MSTRRPNILWICSDQQRHDTLGCQGNDFVRTPHLDRLAAGGMRFTRAFSQSPVCTPSRASFLTGRYPRTTRCRQNGQSIPEDEMLVTRLLADAGYTCGLAGKLHLSPCHPEVTRGSERRIDDGYDEFHWSHHPSPDDWPTNEYFHWLRERGQSGDVRPSPLSRHIKSGVVAEHHQTTWCAQMAINFIEAHEDSDNPWLFSVNIFDPHHDFDPPPEYLQRYLDILDDIPLPNWQPGELADKPPWQAIDHVAAYNSPGSFPFPDMSERDHRLLRAAYWAMVDLIDEQVGRMLAALERTGQLEDTIVIFMSDHGEMLGDHGIYLKGPCFYDPAIQVPLIVSQPGTIAPGVCEDLTELVDLAPTLLEAAGEPVWPGMQGRSLWPLLTGQGEPAAPREDVYSEYYNAMPWHGSPGPQLTMLRTKTHKLVVAHGLAQGELYDLQADPQEAHNRWRDPAYANVRMDLLQRLCDRMAWTVDPLPLREGQW
ncbi:MAG: sulfatase-like hydrolase/transferase [Anaerolineaceae bacterium]|nr:sulfatase-like hydrolase/transferase [Anaerolineaceae bacterium]